MNRIVVCFLSILPVLCYSNDINVEPEKAIEYYSSENVLKFADYLYESGDYLRAAGEYQRYLFSTPKSAGSDSIYYRMIKAIFLGKDFKRCNQLLNSFVDVYPQSIIRMDIPLYKSIMKLYQGNYMESLALAQTPGILNTDLQTIVFTMAYLYLGDFKKAKKWSCQSTTSDILLAKNALTEYGDTITWLCKKIRATDLLPFKSKFRAGFYSSLIPGVGKIYCGRIADGAYSLLIVGLTVWQAYDGFNDNGIKSTKGWIFGVLGTGFYLGNIYGSIVAADLHNHHIRDDFLQGLQIEILLP